MEDRVDFRRVTEDCRMDIEDNRALFRTYIKSLANPESLDHVVVADFIGHDLPPNLPPGVEGLKAFRRAVMRASPDQISEVRDLVVEGDKIAARIWVTGTHRGEFMGIAATGKRYGVDVFEIDRIANGKIAERWALLDWNSLRQQLAR